MHNKQPHISLADLPPEQSDTSPHILASEIKNISKSQYGHIDTRLKELFDDVFNLYEGKWKDYESCQVGYHNIQHILTVALAAARMAAGWNKTGKNPQLDEQTFIIGIIAALFHDAGYLKNKNDAKGNGGKYTFTHVLRSIDLARNYLTDKHWNNEAVTLVCHIIAITEFGEEPDLSVFTDEKQLTIAKIIASADLIAQLADINYVRHLHDLYEEFNEGYEIEGKENLSNRAIHVYSSFDEMLNTTPQFYENFVLPRLFLFGRMDQYLASFFGDDRNPYVESIKANISGQLLKDKFYWQRLGDVLLKHGLVDKNKINEALIRQQNYPRKKTLHQDLEETEISKQLLESLNRKFEKKGRLGNILLEMEAVDPQTLCTGLLSQLIPEELTNNLSPKELLYLLKISLLSHNLHEDPWIFSQLLEITLKITNGESASLLLINEDKNNLIVALHAGPQRKESERKTIALDKGLAGWVYSHGRTAFVNESAFEIQSTGTERPLEQESGSVLAAPLHSKGKIFGVVEIINKKHGNFTDHDANIVNLLANIINMSLNPSIPC